MRVAIVCEVDSSCRKGIQFMLENLWRFNMAWLLAHRNTPKLYEAGVVYRKEPWVGIIEEFASIPVVLARGWGDCDDLSAWRAAELCVSGTPSIPMVIEVPGSREGKRMWHCVTALSGGAGFEDPSLLLGMKGSH